MGFSAGGSLGGAAQGAQLGAAFGPIGMGVGALAGGALGGFFGGPDEEELARSQLLEMLSSNEGGGYDFSGMPTQLGTPPINSISNSVFRAPPVGRRFN